MFSLSDLVKGCVPLECRETVPCSKPDSDQSFSPSEIPATVSMPQESVSLVSSRGEVSTHSESQGSQQGQSLHMCTSSTCWHAPSKSKSSHTPMIGLASQRPSVTIEPVGQSNTASLDSHVPSKDISDKVSPSKAADDGGKRKRYFCKNIDGNTAQFNLSDEDWDKILVTTYPRGGRLLAGDWAEIFRNKLKESNPWCRFGFKNNHVISSNSPKMHSAPFFRGSGKCKLPDCNATVRIAIRKEKGKCADVTYLGNISHKHHTKGCDISK